MTHKTENYFLHEMKSERTTHTQDTDAHEYVEQMPASHQKIMHSFATKLRMLIFIFVTNMQIHKRPDAELSLRPTFAAHALNHLFCLNYGYV